VLFHLEAAVLPPERGHGKSSGKKCAPTPATGCTIGTAGRPYWKFRSRSSFLVVQRVGHSAWPDGWHSLPGLKRIRSETCCGKISRFAQLDAYGRYLAEKALRQALAKGEVGELPRCSNII